MQKMFKSLGYCLDFDSFGALIYFVPIIGVASLIAFLPLIGCAVMCGAMAFMMKDKKKGE